MGLFKRKETKRRETKPPYWYFSLEECEQEISRCEQEISQIERKKRDLEHRLEILSKAKPAHTVFVTDDALLTPTTVIEEQIELIMTELRLLDRKEESLRLEKDSLEKARKKKIVQEQKWTLAQIDVKPIRGTKDLCGEVVLSKTEASHGIEKPIQYVRDSGKVRIMVKIPPGVRDGAKIRCKGLGLIADPPGDLILIVRIQQEKVREGV